jgi:cell division protein FtsB
MNVGVSIWDRLARFVVFLLFVAGLMAVALWYYPLIKQNERYRKEILKLDTQIQKEEDVGKQLRVQMEALRRDNRAVERLARERLGYAKAGETVIRFEAPAPATNMIR